MTSHAKTFLKISVRAAERTDETRIDHTVCTDEIAHSLSGIFE